MHRMRCVAIVILASGGLVSLLGRLEAQNDLQKVRQAEAQRIAVIEKVKPSVIAIFAEGGQGGGSGVVISRDGYALTNFHVVQGMGPTMQCGMPDGVLYDAVLVGLDRVGDVALIKLLPSKPGQEFPYATMGDSDKVKAGDWSLAMGNPFLLATDFTPTVTFGLVSGVHRYQYPESSRGLLEYTDCIQVDTSINPGNSGGPLFNMQAELIGINGRISLEKRGRVNSGVGYAISINQIKNFMGHMRAGLDTDHASLGAFIENRADDTALTGMVVTSILENCDAHRRGLDVNDELVSFAGRSVTNRNFYLNVLGLYPKGWRVPMVYRRENSKFEILVRLMGVQRQQIEDGRPQPAPPPPPTPRGPQSPKKPSNSPAKKFFEEKKGFANFYFNKQERDRVWAAFRKHGDFSGLTGRWSIEGDFEMNQKRTAVVATIAEVQDPSGKGTRSQVTFALGNVVFKLDPLLTEQQAESLTVPTGSGGLLMALYHYRRFLALGEKGFEGNFSHGGTEPFYPMPLDGKPPKSLSEIRQECEVVNTEHAAVPAKWYFSKQDHQLLGFEIHANSDGDPCELYFSDYKKVDNRALPHRIDVRHGNGRFGTFSVRSYQMTKAP